MADSVVQCITVEDVARTTRTAGFYPIDVDPSGPRPRFTVALLTSCTAGAPLVPRGHGGPVDGRDDCWASDRAADRPAGRGRM